MFPVWSTGDANQTSDVSSKKRKEATDNFLSCTARRSNGFAQLTDEHQHGLIRRDDLLVLLRVCPLYPGYAESLLESPGGPVTAETS